MNVAGSVTSAKNRALFYRLENSLIHKFFFGIKKIRFFQKIGFLTPKKNPIFSKNRIFKPQKNPIFSKNRIFKPQKKIRFLSSFRREAWECLFAPLCGAVCSYSDVV
jgi:hypothetical protein